MAGLLRLGRRASNRARAGVHHLAALKSLNGEDSQEVTRTFSQFAGAPLPTFLSPMAYARWWASLAYHGELKTYRLASFAAIGEVDRAVLLDHVSS